jgi:osmoprotectant transport system substrate-binding protein
VPLVNARSRRRGRRHQRGRREAHPEGLVALNVESKVDQKSTKDIAAAWLKANGLG